MGLFEASVSLFLLTTTCITTSQEQVLHEPAADIVFLIDGSQNMGIQGFKHVRTFLLKTINKLNVQMDVYRIGLAQYSDVQRIEFVFNKFRTKRDVLNYIKKRFQYKGGASLYTGIALEFLLKSFFTRSAGSRKDEKIPQIAIIVTSAPSEDNVESYSTSLKKNDVTAIAIGVKKSDLRELQNIAYRGSHPFVYRINEVTRITNLTSDVIETIKNMHNIIKRQEIKPASECTYPWLADIIFLVSESSTIGNSDFQKIRNFLIKVIAALDVGAERIQIGLARYSNITKSDFFLNTFSNKADIIQYLREMIYNGEVTNTGAAMDFVRHYYLTERSGSRKEQGIPQIIIVITAEDSTDSVAVPAAELQSAGVYVYALGIKSVSFLELANIASSPPEHFAILTENLEGFEKDILKRICTTKYRQVLEIPSKDSITQGCFIDIVVGFDLPGWSGSQSIFTGQQKLKLKLQEILQGITSMDDISCISNSQPTINVAFYMQSKTGQVIFETKFENYSVEIINNLKAIQTTGKIDLTVTYLESLGKKLSETTSKAKVILIFTDGLDDTRDVFQKATRSLREKGVHALITVALEGAQNLGDLSSIEFGKGFGYKETLSVEMKDIANALHRQINAIVEKECCCVVCKCLGEPGAQGPRGKKGIQGIQGAKGFPGYLGGEGEPGERGPTGSNGTYGIEGCPGSKGPKGSPGHPGEQGIDGIDGIDGIMGEQGDHGVAGSPGEKGITGNPGRKGQKGDPGEIGKAGLHGDHGEFGKDNKIPGPKGEKGDIGFAGDPGGDGAPGKRGRAGNPGLPGHRGPSGKDGQNGKPGKRGRNGNRGFQGPQGKPGPPGPQGQKREQGARGQQGLPGSEGEQGIEGILGLAGRNGEPGNPGEKGVSGPPGHRGSMGQDGSDGFGPQGSKGRKGERGPQGIIGSKGESGKAGENGEQGPKGMKGNRGHAGDPGDLGEPGGMGIPGQKGPKGPPGGTITPCDLIKTVRASCPCCSARSGACPAYPTELAFALDTSSDVTPPLFERMKKIVINFLQDINIAENNCPTGARVAVLTYHNEAKPFIRFSDFRKKQLLLKKIEELGRERSSKKRNMGNSMQFVARNTFKRVRNGVLVKKIAVFLANGASKDTKAISVAATHFSASNIMPVIISFKDIPEVKRAFKVDIEASAKVIVLPRQQQESKKLLRRVIQCTLCLDECEPNITCLADVQPSPLPVNLDLAFVVDDSEQMESMYSETVQNFLNSMLNTFLKSAEPKASELHPSVAIVQHTPNYTPRYGKDQHRMEFAILDYNTKTLKKRHIQDIVSQPKGSSGIGSTIEWSLKNFFLNITNQQTHKVIFTIFSGETNMDNRKLLEVSHEAKCKGFAVFALVLGEVANTTILEEFVSFPFEQHLVYLDKGLEAEIEYAQKFAVAFLKSLATGINSYPPPDVAMECKGIKPQEIEKDAQEEPSINLQLLVVMDDSENPQSYINNNDLCVLKQEEGLCHNYTIKWFFDNKKGCRRFWYGGCGGNANRFDTRQECETACVKHSLL